MMTRKIKKIACSVICFCFVALGVTAGMVGGFSKRAAIQTAAEEIVAQIDDNYAFGATLTLPTDIEVDGVEYAAEVRIVYPSGKTYKEGKYTLNEYGDYTVIFETTVNERKVSAEKVFKVEPNLYEVSSSDSVVEYTDSLFLPKTENTGGLQIKLANGDEFRYNQPIDITNNGEGRQDIITLYSHTRSQKLGTMAIEDIEAGQLVVTLTDVCDPTNSVRLDFVYLDNGAGAIGLYYRAGVGDGESVGLQVYSNPIVTSRYRREIYIDGVRYVARIAQAGTEGASREKNPDPPMTISFDSETNRIYMYDGVKLDLVSDLDNSDIYDENVFRGFTTGEVYVSIEGRNYNSDFLNFEISEIGGSTGEGLKQSTVVDETAPIIAINAPESDSYTVAMGETVALFEARAFDAHLSKNIETRVYYNYGSALQSTVSVYGGTFVPNKVGVYTIEYTAEDAFGNKTVKTVDIGCAKTQSGRTIDFSVAKAQSLEAGVECTLPEYTVTGLNENVNVKIYAIYGEEVIEIGETLTWMPKNVGVYKIVYEYGDGVMNYEYSYTTEVESSTAVQFFNKPTLPKYFIKGMNYSFDYFYAYTFVNEKPTENIAKIFVKADGAEAYKEIDYDQYTVTAKETLQFRFEYQNVAYETEAIPVVDVGYGSAEGIDMGKYFVGDFTTATSDLYVVLETSRQADECSADFINPVSFSNFMLSFQVLSSTANFKYFDIILTDYYDVCNQTVLTYIMKGNTYQLSHDDSNPQVVTAGLSLSNGVNIVKYKSGLLDVKSNRYFGSAFSPKTDKVMIQIRLREISGPCVFAIDLINNQKLNANNSDFGQPQVLAGTQSGTYALGTIIDVNPATVTDVLSTVELTNVKCKVLAPSGAYVTAKDGTKLDGEENDARKTYQFELVEVGIYRVYYDVKDSDGNSFMKGATVISKDLQAPEIEVLKGYEDGAVVKAKAGTEIALAKYTATDNFTEAENLVHLYLVISPSGEAMLMEDTKLGLTEKGCWRVIYTVCDEATNMSTIAYTIIAE